MAKFLVINGPNLNLLGKREPEIYGSATLADLENGLQAWGKDNNHDVVCRQSNAEHELIDWVHAAAPYGANPCDGIVMNAGAFTHTSVALLDALVGAGVPYVEVHISNVHAREEFRHHSFLSARACGVIVGLGTAGYQYALEHLANQVGTTNSVSKGKSA